MVKALAEKLLAPAKPCEWKLTHSWGYMFQIFSAVSPVEGQERRIRHYQLGSAKQPGWQEAVKSQEAENLTHELQGGTGGEAT